MAPPADHLWANAVRRSASQQTSTTRRAIMRQIWKPPTPMRPTGDAELPRPRFAAWTCEAIGLTRASLPLATPTPLLCRLVTSPGVYPAMAIGRYGILISLEAYLRDRSCGVLPGVLCHHATCLEPLVAWVQYTVV